MSDRLGRKNDQAVCPGDGVGEEEWSQEGWRGQLGRWMLSVSVGLR